mmetsp:Transcript_44474/g.128537  ORF Transcript_44474/g.128537 Transcript_44474/m.128537 type:complete len:211 (+) Transcript_44474:65-697(+)
MAGSSAKPLVALVLLAYVASCFRSDVVLGVAHGAKADFALKQAPPKLIDRGVFHGGGRGDARRADGFDKDQRVDHIAGSLLDMRTISRAREANAGSVSLTPFFMQEPEAQLKSENFVCYSGQLVAVQLPGRLAGEQPVFHYVQFKGMLAKKVRWYVDTNVQDLHFLIFPPTANLTQDWRMVCRRPVRHRATNQLVWGGERVFAMSSGRPC